MERKLKLLLLISGVLLLLVVVMGVLSKFGIIKSSTYSKKEFNDNYDKAIDVLNDKMPTDIFWMGKELYWRDELKIKIVDDISYEALNTDKEYSVLIINDLDGGVELKDEQYKVIKNKIDNDDKFGFFYLGTRQKKVLAEYEIIDYSSIREEDLCVGNLLFEGERTEWCGIYTIEDRQIAEENNVKERPVSFIVEFIVRCYDSNN